MKPRRPANPEEIENRMPKFKPDTKPVSDFVFAMHFSLYSANAPLLISVHDAHFELSTIAINHHFFIILPIR